MERGLRASADRLERLQAVTDAALAHLEVEELLRVLLPRIRDILGTDTCAVLLLDEATDELLARAAVGIDEEVKAGVLSRLDARAIRVVPRPIVLSRALDEIVAGALPLGPPVGGAAAASGSRSRARTHTRRAESSSTARAHRGRGSS